MSCGGLWRNKLSQRQAVTCSKASASWNALVPSLATRFAIACTLSVALPLTLEAQEQAPYLRDRGTGMATSMFGTYVRKGELRLYPFFEWYADHNLEYKPEEFGHLGGEDYRGRYRASEGLVSLATA